MVDLNKQKSLFFMELFLYLIFLDLDKMDIYRDKSTNLGSRNYRGNTTVLVKKIVFPIGTRLIPILLLHRGGQYT